MMIEAIWGLLGKRIAAAQRTESFNVFTVPIIAFRNYGAMLVELCACIPDGVVAFFTSYSYMESLVSEWDAIGILRELTKSKLVFIETKDVVETTLALDNYRRAW